MRIRGPWPSLITEVESGYQMLSSELIEGSLPFADQEPFAREIKVIEAKTGDPRDGQSVHPREQDDEPVVGAMHLIKKRASRCWINPKGRPRSRRPQWNVRGRISEDEPVRFESSKQGSHPHERVRPIPTSKTYKLFLHVFGSDLAQRVVATRPLIQSGAASANVGLDGLGQTRLSSSLGTPPQNLDPGSHLTSYLLGLPAKPVFEPGIHGRFRVDCHHVSVRDEIERGAERKIKGRQMAQRGRIKAELIAARCQQHGRSVLDASYDPLGPTPRLTESGDRREEAGQLDHCCPDDLLDVNLR